MVFPKLIYDDFYKFVTSFTIITFILSVYASYIQIARSNMPGVTEKQVEFLVIYFYVFLIFAIISIILFIWAIRKWRYNQYFYDRKLIAETERAEIDTTLSKKELEKQIEKKVSELPKYEQNKLKTKIDEELEKIDNKNIDLMKIRYLIEERTNQLLGLIVPKKRGFYPLGTSLEILKETRILDEMTIHLIKTVVGSCNKAIHTNKITIQEHDFVIRLSEKILFILEEKLNNTANLKSSL